MGYCRVGFDNDVIDVWCDVSVGVWSGFHIDIVVLFNGVSHPVFARAVVGVGKRAYGVHIFIYVFI